MGSFAYMGKLSARLGILLRMLIWEIYLSTSRAKQWMIRKLNIYVKIDIFGDMQAQVIS